MPSSMPVPPAMDQPPARSPAPADGPDALAFEDLSFRYAAHLAVDQVSLAIAPGEVVCLLGPSGCGKSTLLRLAAGLEAVQQGRVWLAGQVVGGPSINVAPERRRVGLVFQDYALFPHLKALDNVAFGLTSLPGPERRRRALEALDRVDMAGYANAFPHQLSGGQQQRVALARALAPGPQVMLMDEPFSGLDARLRTQVRDQSLAVLRAAGTATMMVTHDPEEAMAMADRIAVMREGRLLQVATPEVLYLSPASAYVAGFFGDLEHVAAKVRDGAAWTPCGPVPAPGHPDGASVRVLIRREAWRPSDDGTAVTVVRARSLGPVVEAVLVLTDGQQVTARLPGPRPPAAGSVLFVRLDQDQAFVFAPGTPT
ncbi:MAG: ABC transporter ATP-binding protein [Alphaproteobacteria bacterium]|nr:ABC transporter ATP-binding protein [Alphaproteobacteria bacterium]